MRGDRGDGRSTDPDGPLDAGEFGDWLTAFEEGQREKGTADVPCDGCTACCSSAQFVHIGPDESETLARIPAALRFPAPRLPRGHVVLGYDERGRCPMLTDEGCSIYDDRPWACRTYDCRVFAATGVTPDEPGKEAVAGRVRRWRFRFASGPSRDELAAVRAAAAFLSEHPDAVPEESARTSTGRAVLALDARRAFRNNEHASEADHMVEPSVEAVRVAIRGARSADRRQR